MSSPRTEQRACPSAQADRPRASRAGRRLARLRRPPFSTTRKTDMSSIPLPAQHDTDGYEFSFRPAYGQRIFVHVTTEALSALARHSPGPASRLSLIVESRAGICALAAQACTARGTNRVALGRSDIEMLLRGDGDLRVGTRHQASRLPFPLGSAGRPGAADRQPNDTEANMPSPPIPAPQSDPSKSRPGDETSPDSPQAAEDVCAACGGTGRIDDERCPDCAGRGTVTVIVGDA